MPVRFNGQNPGYSRLSPKIKPAGVIVGGSCARCKSVASLSSVSYGFSKPFGKSGSGRICSACIAEIRYGTAPIYTRV